MRRVVRGEGIRGSDRQTEKEISWRKDYWKTLKLCLLSQKGIWEASNTIDQLSAVLNFVSLQEELTCIYEFMIKILKCFPSVPNILLLVPTVYQHVFTLIMQRTRA